MFRYIHGSLIDVVSQVDPHVLVIDVLLLLPIQFEYFTLLVLAEVELLQGRSTHLRVGSVVVQLVLDVGLVLACPVCEWIGKPLCLRDQGDQGVAQDDARKVVVFHADSRESIVQGLLEHL